MRVIDLAKATLVCGGTSYVAYAVPVFAQAVLIGALSVLWVFYLRELVLRLRSH